MSPVSFLPTPGAAARVHRFAMLVAAALCLTIARLTSAATAAPPPLELYGQLPKTEALQLSPNGEMIATVFTIKDRRRLAVIKLGGDTVFSANVGDMKLWGVRWAGNGHVVVYMHHTTSLSALGDDDEFLNAVVVNVKTGKIASLLPKSDRYLNAVFGTYGFAEDDGAWQAYVGVVPLAKSGTESYVQQGYANLFKVDLETGRTTDVSRGSSNRRHWVLDGRGAIVARSEYDDKSRTWKIFKVGSSEPVAHGKSDYGFGLAGLGRTPGTVLISHGGADDRLTELNLDTGTQEPLLSSDADLIHDAETRLLVGGILHGKKNETVIFDPVLDKRLGNIRRAFKGATISLVSVSADRSKVVVFIEDDDIPGTWHLVDFNTGQASPIAEKYPGIAADMIGLASIYQYKAADGLEMEGILTLPFGSDGKKLPVVILPHGGPQSMDTLGFDWQAQALTSRGYAVFQPNFRGSDGYGVAFRNAGFGEWGRKMQTDISDGLAALAADGIVDPKRACIVGFSYGGYAALAGVTLQHGVYRCAVSVGGISDAGDMLKQESDRGASDADKRYWRSYLGVEKGGSVSDDISPLKRAAQADAPVLLLHGDKDTVVSIAQSKDMASALRRAGKTVEFINLKDEDHWLSRSATRLEALKAIVAFVEKQNPVMVSGK